MKSQHTILLVDDSENDLLLMRMALKMTKCVLQMQEVRNGEEAVAYLKGEGHYSDRNQFPLPDVMLLDLNMPKMNGFDVLAWVRSQPLLKRLSVSILSASMRGEDVDRALDLGANAFLVKPGSLDGLVALMHSLCEWMKINQFAQIREIRADEQQGKGQRSQPQMI